MIYFLVSIAILTVIFWVLYRAKISPICPICAAVVITWIVGIVGFYLGATWADPLILAILMGASLGGFISQYGDKYGLLWKTALAILGFLAIYLLVQKLLWFGLGVAVIVVLMTLLWPKAPISSGTKKDLFKDCC